MSEEVRQIQPWDPEIREEWMRETDEPEIRNLGATMIDVPAWARGLDESGVILDVPGGTSGWQVSVWAMEFVRSDPSKPNSASA